MATKFITIRIPIPSLSWFRKEEEQSYAASNDLSIRVAEIQSQIAALRSSIERREKSNKNTSSQPQQLVGTATTTPEQDNVRASKEQELADIKAKLLGKKL